MTDKRAQWSLIALAGLAPVAMIVLPWDFANEMSVYSKFVRLHALAVPLFEFAFVLAAMLAGFSPLASLRVVPLPAQWLCALLAIFLLATTVINGTDPLSGAIGLSKLFICGLFALALAGGARSFDENWLRGLWLAVGLGVLAYSIGWCIWAAVTTPSSTDWHRRLPGALNARHIGHFALAGVAAGTAAFSPRMDNRAARLRNALALVFTINGLTLALITGSRGPLFASLLIMASAVLIYRKRLRAILIFLILAASTSIVIATSIRIDAPAYGIERIYQGGDEPVEGARFDASSGRTEIWSKAMDKIAQKPVFGWGVDQYSASGPERWQGMRHPHNLALQILFAGGITLLSLSIALAAIFMQQIDWRSLGATRAVAVSIAAALLVYAQYDGALYFSYPIMIFLIALVTLATPASASDRSS